MSGSILNTCKEAVEMMKACSTQLCPSHTTHLWQSRCQMLAFLAGNKALGVAYSPLLQDHHEHHSHQSCPTPQHQQRGGAGAPWRSPRHPRLVTPTTTHRSGHHSTTPDGAFGPRGGGCPGCCTTAPQQSLAGEEGGLSTEHGVQGGREHRPPSSVTVSMR